MTNRLETSLTGTWELVRTVSTDADGSPMPAPYGGDSAMGLVQLTANGRMVAVLCDSRDTMPDGETREYASYCGAYRIQDNQLITVVDASSRPQWLDTEQVRDISFEGELMVLRPPLRPYLGQPEQRTLYWRKIA